LLRALVCVHDGSARLGARDPFKAKTTGKPPRHLHRVPLHFAPHSPPFAALPHQSRHDHFTRLKHCSRAVPSPVLTFMRLPHGTGHARSIAATTGTNGDETAWLGSGRPVAPSERREHSIRGKPWCRPRDRAARRCPYRGRGWVAENRKRSRERSASAAPPDHRHPHGHQPRAPAPIPTMQPG
jgi:hypothetical protein